MGGVRKVGSVGLHGGRARAGVEVDRRRTGGHAVTASVDEGRRQSSKGAGVFMVGLYFVVVMVLFIFDQKQFILVFAASWIMN